MVMTILPAMMLFLVFRVNSVSRVISFTCALGLLLSAANFSTGPKVGHLAVVILLFGFAVSALLGDRKHQTSVLAVTALLTSYVRPEFFITFILLGLLLVLMCLKAIKNRLSFMSSLPLICVFVPCLLLAVSFGLPLGGQRSMEAFGQHYACNWVVWHGDQRNPWTNWESIVKGDFGNVTSPLEAAAKNPLAMAHHVLTNVRVFPRQVLLFVSFLRSGQTRSALELAVVRGGKTRSALKLAVVAFLLAGLLFALARKQLFDPLLHRLSENAKHYRFLAAPVVAVLLPSAISIAAIAPGAQYLFIFGVLLAAACAVLLFGNTDGGSTDYATLVLACVALILVQPLASQQSTPSQNNLRTIRFLRSLKIQRPVNMLEAEGGYGIYVGENYTRVPEYDKNMPFRSFLTTRSINMVVLSSRLRTDNRFADDQQWLSFVNAPLDWGFAAVEVPDVPDRILFVRSDLLH
jgi:uncharacterized membrane-anchored protein YitT (DUF2179 family)